MRIDPNDHFTQAQLGELRRVQSWRGVGSVLWTWGWIVACFVAYWAHPAVETVVAAWFVMSGRHLALAILMHEGSHGLIVRGKRANDWISQWLTAYPAMVDTLLYRASHFVHHRKTWTHEDPDRQLAAALPVTRASFRRKMLRDLSGKTAYKRHRGLVRYSAGLSPMGKGLEGKPLGPALRSFARVQRGFLITNGLMLGALSAAGIPEAYLLIWWLPFLTGYSVVLRLRSIAEHACVKDETDPLLNTRTTLAPGWLRFLIAPHHVNYHLEHHVLMTVPHYNLPKAHRILAQGGVLERAEVATSYLEVLARATSVPEPVAERVPNSKAA